MNTILYILVVLIQFLLVIIATVLIIYIYYLLRNLSNPFNVPFVPSTKTVVKKIIKSGLINNDACFCDIGCGTGTVLLKIARECNPQKCVGIENKKMFYFLAKINLLVNKTHTSNIELIHKDIKDFSIKNFSVIYIFMTERFIKENLMTKFKNELKPGTIIISNMFKLPYDSQIKLIRKTPTERIMGTSKMSYLRIYKVMS